MYVILLSADQTKQSLARAGLVSESEVRALVTEL